MLDKLLGRLILGVSRKQERGIKGGAAVELSNSFILGQRQGECRPVDLPAFNLATVGLRKDFCPTARLRKVGLKLRVVRAGIQSSQVPP